MIKHIRFQILLVVVGAGLLVALLGYVALNFTTEWVGGSGGTYVEGLAGFPQYVNPLLCRTFSVDGDLCALIFNGLTRIDYQGQVQSDLAKTWEISPDGLTYTFRLRSGVRWHDGTPFTADDVVFTVDLLQDPGFPGQSDWLDLWRSVTVLQLDAHTVRFQLEQPYAGFLDYTTFGILPRHALQDVQAADLYTHPFNLNPIGTGVFAFSEIVTDTGGIAHVILEANPFYFERRPLIGRIQFKFYPSPESVYSAYLDQEVQGVSSVAAENLVDARSNDDLQLFSSTLPRLTMIYLNLASDTAPFFQDVKVRQALLYALDRQTLVNETLDGQGTVAHSPVFPDSWAYNPNIPTFSHDPEKAVELLKEAGWRATYSASSFAFTDTAAISPTVSAWFKDGRPLSFSLLVPDDPSRIAVAEEIARQWSLVGVRANIEKLATGLLTDRLEPRLYQSALVDIDSTASGDPDPYPFWHQTQIHPPGQNYAAYDSREMSEIIETARLTPDQEARKGLYDEFQQLFAADVPALLLYHPIYTYAVDRYVYGVNVGPIVRPGDRFLGIADWYVRWRRVIRSDTPSGQFEASAP